MIVDIDHPYFYFPLFLRYRLFCLIFARKVHAVLCCSPVKINHERSECIGAVATHCPTRRRECALIRCVATCAGVRYPISQWISDSRRKNHSSRTERKRKAVQWRSIISAGKSSRAATGRSVVAAAAYRAADHLMDERMTIKSEITRTNPMLPMLKFCYLPVRRIGWLIGRNSGTRLKPLRNAKTRNWHVSFRLPYPAN